MGKTLVGHGEDPTASSSVSQQQSRVRRSGLVCCLAVPVAASSAAQPRVAASLNSQESHWAKIILRGINLSIEALRSPNRGNMLFCKFCIRKFRVRNAFEKFCKFCIREAFEKFCMSPAFELLQRIDNDPPRTLDPSYPILPDDALCHQASCRCFPSKILPAKFEVFEQEVTRV